jgi:hypothetical protein
LDRKGDGSSLLQTDPGVGDRASPSEGLDDALGAGMFDCAVDFAEAAPDAVLLAHGDPQEITLINLWNIKEHDEVFISNVHHGVLYFEPNGTLMNKRY